MFSKSCKYAIRAVLHLALHAKDEHKCSVAELAEDLQVPKHFLAKVLQTLSKHGLISSVKGPNGGFYLSKENRASNLEQVILCIDGPAIFKGCVMGLSACSAKHPCPLHAQATAYREGLYYQLKHQTIEEMATRIERQGLCI